MNNSDVPVLNGISGATLFYNGEPIMNSEPLVMELGKDKDAYDSTYDDFRMRSGSIDIEFKDVVFDTDILSKWIEGNKPRYTVEGTGHELVLPKGIKLPKKKRLRKKFIKKYTVKKEFKFDNVEIL